MSKAPTGITISRNGGSYAVSWKCGDKNYGKGQQFQYRINSGKWTSLSVGAGTRAKTVALNLANYYPTKSTILYSVSVRIRGKVNSNKSKWSAWSAKTYTNYVPNVPSLEASLDDQQTNKCTFTWNLTTATTDVRPYYHVRWETILVKESDVTDGSKLTWDSSALGWDTGVGSYASSVSKAEDTTLLANDSYTRWFRVCGRGARGSSDWRYAKHVYARPYQAKIEEAEVTRTDAEGLTCYARWKADQTASHPIDYTTVQYLITVPNAGLVCPSGAQWSDANISADTEATDAVRFSIDDVLDKDECLFVRVNTVHDTNITYSEPKLAAVGDLKDPTDLSYQVDNVNHTLTSVSVDNNSDVPDSFIAIAYKAGSNPENEIVVGIIPHGASQPLVTPVQCPDWSGESTFSIGAYAVVGSYEANSVGYTVKAEMRSAGTIWVGGAVPVAPENVNVVQSPITGTATVTWDWTWEEATFAQLSWTDHDDAWESTDEPEIYNITKPKATKWNISGLELGKKWFIAVRLVSGNPEDENAIYSPWSEMKDITLSSVPNIPTLNLSSSVITEGEEITASWDFVSNDGTGQISAEIKDENDNLIAHTETQNEVVIDTEALGWAQGEVHSLSVRVTSESNRTTDWSNHVSIVVAEALEGYIAETSLEMKTVEINPESFDEADLISFDTEQEEVFTKLQVNLEPVQDLHGYDAPWPGGAGKNKLQVTATTKTASNVTMTVNSDGTISLSGTANALFNEVLGAIELTAGTTYHLSGCPSGGGGSTYDLRVRDANYAVLAQEDGTGNPFTPTTSGTYYVAFVVRSGVNVSSKIVKPMICLESATNPNTFAPYENICPISGWDEVDVNKRGKNLVDSSNAISGLCAYQAGQNIDYVVASTRYSHSVPINAEDGLAVTFRSNDISTFYVILVECFDSQGNWVYQYNPSLLPDTTTTRTVIVPANTYKWVRLAYSAPSGGIVGTDIDGDVMCVSGSTATSYEPYNGTTYTQDIEATYTPTVQESEVYLFKQTGDVGGDRETIELVGGSVAWNQWVDDIASATKNGITCTHNGDGSCTFNGTSTARAQFFKAVDAKHVNVNDKILICANNLSGTCSGEMGLFFYLLPDDGSSTIYPVLTVFNASGVLNKTAEIKSISKSGTIRGESLVVDFYNSGVTATSLKFIPQMFNLTQMFGSTIADYIYSLEQANTGDGVAFFRNLFPKSYYPYNASELISVKTSSHDTVGKNLLPNKTYQKSATELIIGNNANAENVFLKAGTYTLSVNTTKKVGIYYTQNGGGNKTILTSGTGDVGIRKGTFTLTENGNCKFWFYISGGVASSDVEWFQLELGSQATDYEPYTKNTYPLDADLELRGLFKLENSKLKAVGDVYSSSGNVQRKYKQISPTALVATTYQRTNGDTIGKLALDAKATQNNNTLPNIICNALPIETANGQYAGGASSISCGTSGEVLICIAGVTSASALTTWLSNNSLDIVYELATPTTETADAFEEIQKVTPIYGTEEFVDNRAVPIPVGNNAQYLTRDIYGGYIDFVNGLLVLDRKCVDLGTLNWITLTASSTGKQYFETQNEVADMKKSTGNIYVQPIISSHYKPEAWQNTLDRTGYDGSIAEGWAGKSYIVIYDSSKATLSASEFKTAMNGVQLVYPLAEPMIFQLTLQQIQTLVGKNNVWSEQGQVVVKIAETYKDVLSLTEMPLIVKLAGVNDNIISTLTVERTADYHMDRPNETQFDGFEGEIVYLTTQNGGEDIIINQEDLIGLMDDEAPYRVFVTFKDVYGQSMNDSVDFEVHWEHQAIIPEATVEIDSENLIAKLTPVAPTGTLEGDTCDIYRLSADRPELIVKDAVFGTQYVDPYPAIGEFGGHRFVFKTANGDYITEDNDIAWFDTGEEDGDILESEKAIIDFDGKQLLLYYNVDVGHQWDKDFQQTKYLGGSIQGDWNAGVSRSGSISAVMITLTDSDQIRMMKELAVYTGVCHVRTTDGSSYTADVQVAEDRDHDDYGKLASFSLTITRVDAETLDGLTYEQWSQEEE